MVVQVSLVDVPAKRVLPIPSSPFSSLLFAGFASASTLYRAANGEAATDVLASFAVFAFSLDGGVEG